MWPIKTTLFFLGFTSACILSLAYPIIGVANYMMVYLVNPNKMWWGKYLKPLGLRYSMTAAVCLILGMIISSGRVPKVRGVFGPWESMLILFTLIVLVSGIFGPVSSDYSVQLMDKMVKMSLFMLCLTRMASTSRNYTIVLWTLVLGTMVIGWDAYNASDADFFRGRLNFVGGPDFRESSGLAAHMAAMIPLIGICFLTTPSWRWKVTAIASGLLTVNTVVQCRTRSAFVGIAAGAVIAVLLAPRGRRFRVYGALIVFAAGAFSLTDDFFWNRMNTVFRPSGYATDETIRGRHDIWMVSLVMFGDHPLGVGVGRFRDTIGDYNEGHWAHAFGLPRRVTHNSYLLCATELGLQGLLVLAALLAISIHRIFLCMGLAKRTGDPPRARLQTYGLAISLTIYAVTATFTDRLYTESFWWVLALPICLERALRREALANEFVPELANQEWNTDEEPEYQPAWPASHARGAFG